MVGRRIVFRGLSWGVRIDQHSRFCRNGGSDDTGVLITAHTFVCDSQQLPSETNTLLPRPSGLSPSGRAGGSSRLTSSSGSPASTSAHAGSCRNGARCGSLPLVYHRVIEQAGLGVFLVDGQIGTLCVSFDWRDLSIGLLYQSSGKILTLLSSKMHDFSGNY
jgi:hypothetical protein